MKKKLIRYNRLIVFEIFLLFLPFVFHSLTLRLKLRLWKDFLYLNWLMIAVVVGNGDDDDDFDANYRVCSVFKFCMFDNSYWFGKIEKKVERRKNCEYSIWWDVWINRLHIDCYMMVMVMMIMKIEIKKEMKKKESINRIFDPFYSIQWKNRFLCRSNSKFIHI